MGRGMDEASRARDCPHHRGCRMPIRCGETGLCQVRIRLGTEGVTPNPVASALGLIAVEMRRQNDLRREELDLLRDKASLPDRLA